MTPEKRNALVLAISGAVFTAVAFSANALVGDSSPRIAEALGRGIVGGNLIVVGGSIQLARAKGLKWYAGLFGVLNVLGFAIVWFALPDRNESAVKS